MTLLRSLLFQQMPLRARQRPLPFLGMINVGQVFVMVIEEFLEFMLAVFTMTVLWAYLQEALNCHE